VAACNAFDESCMRRALALAVRGLSTTDPNPRVGCVIALGEEVIGEGWHRRAGEPHAEVLALMAAGARARGATAYVTLEPCSHFGRTPPCADALIAAGIARVVAATQDPDPRVDGRGSEKLRAANIQVDTGLLAREAEALNPGFFRRNRTGRPWIRLKLAMTLDGRTALPDGAGKWITGEDARGDVQRWRARSSVIVTGVGTVLADDPRLDVRIAPDEGEARQPLRVVLDSRGRTPARARILAPPGECWLCIGRGQTRPAATTSTAVHELPLAGSGVDLTALLSLLTERGVNEVWVESGPRLAGAFISQGLVDELVLYIAPRMLGPDARPLVQIPSIGRVDDGPRWRYTDLQHFGEDLRIIAVPR